MTESAREQTLVPADADAGGNRRLLVLGGAAAAFALAGGGYFLLSGGSSANPTALAPVHRGVHVLAVTKKAAPPAKSALVVVPAVSTVPIGRDPFKALYAAPVAAPATVAATGTSTPPPSTTTPTTTSSGGSTTPTSVTPAATTYRLVLKGVSAGTASFSVGGKLMTATVGSVFGPTAELKLLNITQNAKGVPVAVLQEGDSDPFDATKGVAITVR